MCVVFIHELYCTRVIVYNMHNVICITIIRQGDDEGETHTHTHRSANNSSCARFHIFRRISDSFRQHFQPFTQQSNQESSTSVKIRRQIKKKKEKKKFVGDDKRLEMGGENNIPRNFPKKRRRGWKMNQHKIFINNTKSSGNRSDDANDFHFLFFPPSIV